MPLSYLAALVQGSGTESVELTVEQLPSIVPESLHPTAVDWCALAVELLPSKHNTDAGVAYAAYAVIGGITLANPGQVAPVVFVTTDCMATGSRVDPSVLFDELPATGTFTDLNLPPNPIADPPELVASATIYNDRWYISEAAIPSLCRWMFLRLDWPAEDFNNEILDFTIWGTINKE